MITRIIVTGFKTVHTDDMHVMLDDLTRVGAIPEIPRRSILESIDRATKAVRDFNREIERALCVPRRYL